MREKYGAGFETILYVIGFEIGYHAYENHVKLLGNDINVLLRAGTEFFQALGYGVLEVVKFSYGNAISRIYNNFECELFKGSEKSASHFVRGLIVGWDTVAWNVDINRVKSVETKCIAKGDSYCEIHVTID